MRTATSHKNSAGNSRGAGAAGKLDAYNSSHRFVAWEGGVMRRHRRKWMPQSATRTAATLRKVRPVLYATVSGAIVACQPSVMKADEGGVSFWVPGFFGSLAATPQQPGFSFATIYYHTPVSAGGDVAFARQVTRGNITANFSGTLNANLNADADLVMVVPSYVFATPVLGGQAAVALLAPYGRSKASVDATLVGTLGPIPFTLSGGRTDTVTAFGDVAPQFALRWNAHVHNWVAYATGNLTVGAYDSKRLANLGIGHNAIDAGAGYTYFNPQTGLEFSAVAGLTYNFENTHTSYKNGIDFHLDWGASQFLGKQWHVGVVGYVYQQLTGDSGAGNRLGDFKSRVFSVGPQIGYIFPIGGQQGYLNLKGYKEFGAEHRPEGWNTWLTFAISPAAPESRSQARPMVTE